MELLAPAGNIEGFKAVLAQKPDVIYLGAGELNARSSEAQFSLDDLAELVSAAKREGVKIYFTLNVLVKDSEIGRALEIAEIAYNAGVYAFIVQDKGLMHHLKKAFPDIILHASTQCSVGSEEQILELSQLGVSRIVLARELSLATIRKLTSYAHSVGIEVEVFAHGATCMSVSGQCHMSQCIGGRSANRGECAQPCRQVYKLYNGPEIERDFAAYLSPKDLSYFKYMRELTEAQVDALKIEGRLRSAEYQSQVTAIFKTAMEELNTKRRDEEIFTDERKRNLKIAFNRGGSFQASFLKDNRDASFLSTEHVGHQGLYLGKLERIDSYKGLLSYIPDDSKYIPKEGSQISLKNSQDVTVATAPVGVVTKRNNQVEIKGFHPKILESLYPPLGVWQQKQARVPEQDNRETANPDKIPVSMSLREEDAEYILTLKTDNKYLEYRSSELNREIKDTGHPIEASRLQEQLAKLGNTPYELAEVEIELEPEEGPTWRISDFNAFRRAALDALEAAPATDFPHSEFRQVETEVRNTAANVVGAGMSESDRVPTSIQQIINLPNFQAGDDLSEIPWTENQLIVLPLEELFLAQLEGKLAELKKNLGPARLGAYLAPLKAWSAKENPNIAVSELANAGLDALVSSTSGTVELINEMGLADANLELFLWQGGQVWNRTTYNYFSQQGYQGITVSPELSWRNQLELAEQHKDNSCRPIVFQYGRLESMFTRFCPVGYSQGAKGCQLCRQNRKYSFEDKQGHVYPLTPKKFADCSFQVWHSKPLRQEVPDYFIRAYNFVEEDPEEIREILCCDLRI